MYGGLRWRMNASSAPGAMASPSFTTMYAAMYLPLPPSLSKACTVTSPMEGCSRITASTSVSSMRKPRIFTWPSLRPIKSISPFGR